MAEEPELQDKVVIEIDGWRVKVNGKKLSGWQNYVVTPILAILTAIVAIVMIAALMPIIVLIIAMLFVIALIVLLLG